MPKGKRAKNCFVCESQDRVRYTFMICHTCRRYYRSEHGVPHMDQCTTCVEAGEVTD